MRRSDGLFDWIDHHVTRAAVIARRISRHGNVCRDEQGATGRRSGCGGLNPRAVTVFIARFVVVRVS